MKNKQNNSNTLKLNAITTVRGNQIINNNICLNLNSGEAISVRGNNGAGKTTLLRCIAGFIVPNSGTISLNNTISEAQDLNASCHFVGEQNALKNHHTPHQDLTYWAKITRVKKAIINSRIESALKAFRITHLTHITTELLSQGQKKQIIMARLIMLNRPIWLLDEPYSGLDTQAVIDLNIVIKSHLKNGGIVICASHTHIDFCNQTINLDAPNHHLDTNGST